MSEAPAAIVCDAVTKTYTDGSDTIVALDSFSCEFRGGETIAVTGPSGSGKSTLLSLLAAIDYADHGTIRVGDLELGDLSTVEQADYRARYVSYLYPDFNLLPILTVYENLSLALSLKRLSEFEIDRRIRSTLDELELGDLAHRKPSALSSGQRARTGLARALAAGNPILIADEPTAHLDAENARLVADLLARTAAGGRLVVVATHDPAVAAYATRVVDLRNDARA